MMIKRDATGSGEGFTLMELLVVIAILGILMGLLVPALSASRYAAQKTRVRAEVKQLETAWKAYYDDYRELPNLSKDEMDVAAVEILHGDEDTHNFRQFMYMEFSDDALVNGLVDKWGNFYQVVLDDDGDGVVNADGEDVQRPVAVWSAGRDDGDATDDIRSWD